METWMGNAQVSELGPSKYRLHRELRKKMQNIATTVYVLVYKLALRETIEQKNNTDIPQFSSYYCMLTWA